MSAPPSEQPLPERFGHHHRRPRSANIDRAESRSFKSNKAAVIRARYNELLSRLGESIGVEGVIAQIPARQGPSTTQAAPTAPKPSQFAQDVRSVDQVHGQV